MSFFGMVGILGVAFYLGSYAALQFGVIQGRGYLYATLNLIAAGCVLISLAEAFNLSSALIQVFWITISLIGMIRFYLINSRVHMTEAERAFADACLEGLTPADQRKVLDLGLWEEAAPGTLLVSEGKPVSHLFWIVSGAASISCEGRDVSVMRAGDFIGEITVLSGEPATATARVTEPTLSLCIPGGALRTLAAKNVDIRLALQHSFTQHLRSKLERSTRSVAAAQMAHETAAV